MSRTCHRGKDMPFLHFSGTDSFRFFFFFAFSMYSEYEELSPERTTFKCWLPHGVYTKRREIDYQIKQDLFWNL